MACVLFKYCVQMPGLELCLLGRHRDMCGAAWQNKSIILPDIAVGFVKEFLVGVQFVF
jgi:hypothetical protein